MLTDSPSLRVQSHGTPVKINPVLFCFVFLFFFFTRETITQSAKKVLSPCILRKQISGNFSYVESLETGNIQRD